ncbi:extracellular solute-binding protein [Phycicoccus sp. BSK3Z-2]|uniref:Extracellular solute-binding protein n=1 Tax=Phycicoccus avicenniae TaxID=2828860 RepID=A0A941D411_9MICO|nr:extracellular solute-binding protein [Phycicoccus avicenniae]MBR7741699.1 extracellular solute-binding protein [Phycicoccus avicenniae]
MTAALVTVSIALGGCGRSDDGPQTNDVASVDDSPAEGDLTVWAFTNQAAAVEQISEGFVAENPDVSVSVTPVSVDELPRKLETAIASGEVPDIIQPSTGLQTYAETGGIAPVPEDLMDWDAFFPGAIDTVTFDEVKYAVPWYVTVFGFYYRADLAEEAGVEAPTTWDEVLDFAAALESSEGMANPYFQFQSGTAAWQTLVTYMYSAGAELVVDDEFDFDSPEVVAALEYYQQVFADEYTNINFAPTAVGEVEAAFADGRVGSYVTGSYSYDVALEALGGDDSKIGVVPLPAGPAGGNAYLGGSGLAVTADSQNKDAAFKLLRWMSTPESQQELYEVSSVLPAATGAWESGPLAESESGRAFAAQLENSTALPAVETWTRVREVLATYAEQLARQVITPEDAAAAIQQEAAAIGTGR